MESSKDGIKDVAAGICYSNAVSCGDVKVNDCCSGCCDIGDSCLISASICAGSGGYQVAAVASWIEFKCDGCVVVDGFLFGIYEGGYKLYIPSTEVCAGYCFQVVGVVGEGAADVCRVADVDAAVREGVCHALLISIEGSGAIGEVELNEAGVTNVCCTVAIGIPEDGSEYVVISMCCWEDVFFPFLFFFFLLFCFFCCS